MPATKTKKVAKPEEPLTRAVVAEVVTEIVTVAIQANNIHLATKQDIADLEAKMATKDDLEQLAKKYNLKNMASKDDLAQMENRLKRYTGKEVGAIMNDVLERVNAVVAPIQRSVERLEKKYERLFNDTSY